MMKKARVYPKCSSFVVRLETGGYIIDRLFDDETVRQYEIGVQVLRPSLQGHLEIVQAFTGGHLCGQGLSTRAARILRSRLQKISDVHDA